MLKLLDKLTGKRSLSAVNEDDPTVDVEGRELPDDILASISKLKLGPRQTVMVTISNKVVTKERQDPLTGSSELLCRNTTRSHKLTIVQTG